MRSRTLPCHPPSRCSRLPLPWPRRWLRSSDPRSRRRAPICLRFWPSRTTSRRPSCRCWGRGRRKVSEGSSYELWGDYTFATQAIRVWMRTAVLGKVTSYRGLLNTILHEFCHHLDVKRFGWPDTPHTRGFFCRIDDLYHLALATPADQRRPLVWIKGRNTWRIDWTKLRSRPAITPKATPQGTTQAP
jgi:hypothetical protein